jgi:hypothetical protein
MASKDQNCYGRDNYEGCDYQNLMHKHLLSEGSKIGGRGWIYQQHNASVHGAKPTTEWFKKKKEFWSNQAEALT